MPDLSSLREHLSWQDQANCRHYDPEDWFSVDSETTRKARRRCLECPVMTQCRAWALESGIPYGVYGALTEDERREAWRDGHAREARILGVCDRCRRTRHRREHPGDYLPAGGAWNGENSGRKGGSLCTECRAEHDETIDSASAAA